MVTKKFSLLYTLLFLGLNLNIFCQDSEQKQDELLPDIKKELEKIDLQKELEDDGESGNFFMDQIQNPAKMLERLPQESRKVVLAAIEVGRDLLANSQHPTIFLFDVLQNLLNKSEDLFARETENKEVISNLLTCLKQIQGLLSSKEFQLLIFLGSKNEKIEVELKEKAGELEKSFVGVEQNIFPEKKYLKEQIEILKNSLLALSSGDIDLLTKTREIYLKEVSTQAFAILDKAKVELDILKKSLTGKEDKELAEAIEFWQEAIQEFDALRPSKWVPVVNAAGKVAPFVEGSYFFYRKILELYQIDHPECLALKMETFLNPLSLLGLMGDQAFRLAMIPIHFLRKVSQISKAGLSPQMMQLSVNRVVAECIGIYLDPNFCVQGLHWPFRAFYRIIPAIAYKSIDTCFQINKDLENFLLELPKDEKFRRAIWFSMKDGYLSFAGFLANQIRQHVNPETLKKIENGSLGIIKPELLGFILNTAVPIFALSEYFPKSYVDLQKKEIFSNEIYALDDYFSKIINSRLRDWNYVGEQDFPDNAYFIEGRILGYLATNVGSYLGREFTRMNRRPIKFLSSKILKGFSVVLSKLGFIEKADWQEPLLKDLKSGVQDLMNADPTMIILVQKVFFPMLVGLGIMSQLEVAKLEVEFNSGMIDESKIDFIVDRIFSSITDSCVMGLGGCFGSLVAWCSADYLMKKQGPFWPKIKTGATAACEIAEEEWATVKGYFAS